MNLNLVIGVLIVIVIVVILILYFIYENKEPSFLDQYPEDVKTHVEENNLELHKEESNSASKCVSNENQVFNVGNNLYTYEDAKQVCKSFDGELASLQQVMDAYKDGADWCNYGWIKGQMAVYPTQKETWEELQRSNTKKYDCGMPGVNGGYFKNDKFLFGANCFAKKPLDTKENTPEKKLMNKLVKPEDYEFRNAQQLDDLEILPFNKDKWSQ